MSKKKLVIVESPAKGKTIEKFLGSDYIVKSSFGHIRDLPKKGLNVDIDNNFEPSYEVTPDKKKTVTELKKATKLSESVWLASDEDREGEAIAWHLCQALGLDQAKTKRIVFHEITKEAILTAVANPRQVNKQLVDAQQARRILDRLVGYELSPVLWKKVRPGLSAGRVQSVAVRLIVEREREIKDFKPLSSFKVTALLKSDNLEFPAELSQKLEDLTSAQNFLEECKLATFSVHSTSKKPGSRNPGAPFTTSTLQQEAARKLGYSVKQTMTLAQRLYENGYITYMRTDSTMLSSQAVKSAEKYIKKTYGDQYHTFRQYKTKSSGAQEAHEAIRPSDFSRKQAGQDSQQEKLYQLIWRRTLASQMAAALVDKTEIVVNISNRPETFLAKGEILKFDGFYKVYGGSKDDVILPELKDGQALSAHQITATESFSKAPARYSEASLVRKLEELGIGRPSTYAPTISTIQARGYVERANLDGDERQFKVLTLRNNKIEPKQEIQFVGADKNKLLPTPLADVTTDFLVKNFASIVNYDFTAKVEQDFDTIANGQESWQQMINNFYTKFHPLVIESDKVSREESTQTRVIGKDPKSGKPIMARYGRYGPMLQRGETESEEKPDFAPLPEGVSMNDVTLEQALEMFKLPRTVGKTEEGQEIKANIGRFGPYIQIGKLFVSIKPHDPMKITEQEARELYIAKLAQEAKKNIREFASGIKVLRGMYGPYVTDGKKNARIPKEIDATKLSEADAKALIDKAPSKKRQFSKRRTNS